MSGDAALKRLLEGNRRYVAAKFAHPNQSIQRRVEVAKKQSPFAVILTCADSRVAPEIVFDQGLGDLFVLRVAGNVTSPSIIGSIEYAVEHLGSPLVMVMGHERCGAVDAALKGVEAEGYIGYLVEAIQPAVEQSRGQEGDPLDNAVKANVKRVVRKLKSAEPVLSHLIRDGKVKIVGARYDLDSGRVTLVP